MTANIDQIVAKLTSEELELLQQRLGFDLRGPAEIEALEESLSETRRRIRAIGESAP